MVGTRTPNRGFGDLRSPGFDGSNNYMMGMLLHMAVAMGHLVANTRLSCVEQGVSSPGGPYSYPTSPRGRGKTVLQSRYWVLVCKIVLQILN